MNAMKIPSFDELLTAYALIAARERLKNQRPAAVTVRNVLNGARRLLAVTAGDARLPLSEPVTWLTHRRLDNFLAQATAYGINPTSARTYLAHLRALTARWTRPYYADLGWRVPPFPLPACRRCAPRYVRPERATLLRVKDWYENLRLRKDARDWLTATLMLEFALRNSDIRRLRWCDFRLREDQTVLCYTPHKTELSSGRTVAWPVHPDLWQELCAARAKLPPREGTHFQGLVVPAARSVFQRLNEEIHKAHFFCGTHKGLYELRKICIDHVYQHLGAERASALSGDDIRTVTRYYADPSAVATTGIRITNLL